MRLLFRLHSKFKDSEATEPVLSRLLDNRQKVLVCWLSSFEALELNSLFVDRVQFTRHPERIEGRSILLWCSPEIAATCLILLHVTAKHALRITTIQYLALLFVGIISCGTEWIVMEHVYYGVGTLALSPFFDDRRLQQFIIKRIHLHVASKNLIVNLRHITFELVLVR